MKITGLITILFIISSVAVKSQNLENLNKTVGLVNYRHNDRIKSVKVFKSGNVMSEPVILLNGNEILTVDFDDVSMFDESPRDLYYKVVHCDADWRESALMYSEYATGFEENKIRTRTGSVNTSIRYTNYQLNLPNSDTRLKISGNFLIKIFDDDTKELLLVRSFSITEAEVGITAFVEPYIGRGGMQQLSLRVNHQRLNVEDAYINLKIRVAQNSVRLTEVPNPTPVSVSQGSTDYNRSDKNIYPGGNEFRVFDIRNLTYSQQGVSHITQVRGSYRAELLQDALKEGTQYINNPDANGKFMTGSAGSYNANVQSDYVNVKFSLSSPFPLDGRVFVFGEFTDWALNPETEMYYNASTRSYDCDMLLKQGYYNYKYAVLNDNKPSFIQTEGNFGDTENSYSVYVYFRPSGERYDRLVGYQNISSRASRPIFF